MEGLNKRIGVTEETEENKQESKPEKPIGKGSYTKSRIIASKTYKYKKDLVSALLDDNKKYTKAEVDKLIKDYLSRGVK